MISFFWNMNFSFSFDFFSQYYNIELLYLLETTICMTFTDQKQSIKNFIKEREWKWYEKWQSQPFWIDLLSKVLWVENPTQFIEFEDHVKIDKANWFIVWFIPSTKVLIEQAIWWFIAKSISTSQKIFGRITLW